MVALSAVMGYELIKTRNSASSVYGPVINRAGRQRMLSQQIAKQLLQLEERAIHDGWVRSPEGEKIAATADSSLEQWSRAHTDLLSGRVAGGFKNSESAHWMFLELDEPFVAMRHAAQQTLSAYRSEGGINGVRFLEALHAYMEIEPVFLTGMERLVGQYQADQQVQAHRLDLFHLGAMLLTLTVLALEIVFVFEPALRLIRRQIGRLETETAEAFDNSKKAEIAELKAVRAEQTLQLAVRGSQDGIWEWDLDSDLLTYSERWCEILGLAPHEVGRSSWEWFKRIVPDQVRSFEDKLKKLKAAHVRTIDVELEMFHADGSKRWVLCRGVVDADEVGDPVRIAGSIADITKLKETQRSLEWLATHDQLTGLANRERFMGALADAIDRFEQDPDQNFAVLSFDFDRFKCVNDSCGHRVGDLLLKSIADRFRAAVRANDVIARFGGDEFAVLLGATESEQVVRAAADRYLSVFSDAHHVGGHRIVSTASIGIAPATRDARLTPEDMVARADAAMYQAKAAGRRRCRFFDEELHNRQLKRVEIEHMLRGADMDAEFEVQFQPIFALADRQLTGMEALVRWNHPVEGRMSPGDFIPIAEECGYISELGEWVLRTAATQVAKWRELVGNDHPLYVNVNVSRKQLLRPGFVGRVEKIIQESGARVSDIRLEITETTIMDERSEIIPILESLRELGLKLVMDDFGSGHSSLSCLHSFPIDVVKIDRGFITGISVRREFAAVIRSIVELSQALGLQVVAEGVETHDQAALLLSIDCGYVQGYLFGKPASAETIEGMLVRTVPERWDLEAA